MVERLKEAIEKARRARQAQERAAPTSQDAAAPVGTLPVRRDAANAAWEALPTVTLDMDHLKRHRLVAAGKADPAHLAFDLLRTRLTAKCRELGLRRIAITSPTKGCGKSFVTLNLAFSIARNRDIRTVLVDVDFRAPMIATALGMTADKGTSDYVSGDASLEAVCHRVGLNLAICPNIRRVRDSSELLASETAVKAIQAIDASLRPDLILYDLPPMFGCDDTLGFLPNVDAIILIARGGHTSAADLAECERLLEGGPLYLGVVLNAAEDANSDSYKAHYGETEPA